jgi:hypothetical protein
MESLKSRLLGTWKLISYTLKDEEGKEYYPMGEDCKGFLMYNPDGYVSAQLMTEGRPAYASRDLHNGTIEEMAAAAHGYIAYAGKFEVDETKMTLKHTMEVSMNPTWLGQTQERYLKLDGDTVTITADVNTAVLKWRKVK